MMRRPVAMFTMLAAMALPLAASLARADGQMTPAAAEALYARRFAQYMQGEAGMGLAFYDTLVPVAGAAKARPLPAGNSGAAALPAVALGAARDYAAANKSSAFLVWHAGRMVAQDYFDGSGPDSLVVSKSLAKPLGVIAVGRAMALGRIASLDQPAATWFPEWRGTPKAAITIRQILGMRSGLLPQGNATDAANVLNRAYLHPFHDRVLLNEYPLTQAPGSRYDYSNANGDLVAILIARATGVPYQTFVGQQVLRPLGAKGGQIWLDRPGGTPHSGCCILLPADSYLRLGILLAQDGVWQGRRLLPAGFVTQMRTTTPQNPHAGLGVYVGAPYVERRGPANPSQLYGATYHSAHYLADDLFLFDGNANQVVYIIPSRQLVILRTGEKPPARPEWDNAKLPNLLLGAM